MEIDFGGNRRGLTTGGASYAVYPLKKTPVLPVPAQPVPGYPGTGKTHQVFASMINRHALALEAKDMRGGECQG